MKPLADGSKIVGLFNRQGQQTARMAVEFSQIGLHGEVGVRDLWLKKDLGTFKDTFSAYVPAHGVVLVRIHSQ
jgi:alpha-galactosidase